VKLTALLGDDRYKLQDGTRRDMVSMKSELEPVLDLLGKLRGADDVACKDWVTEARELSYDMEDGFDAFTDGLERGDAGSFIQRDDGRPFKELVERVKVVSNRCGEMQKIVRNRSELTSDDPRALFLHSKDASELVGMEAKKDELVELLQKHELVCVVGFAGMGKTTLADLVYQTVKDQFQCRAFVSLHPSPDMKRILRTIHSQAADGATVVSASAARDATEKNLIDDISAFLDDKRYANLITSSPFPLIPILLCDRPFVLNTTPALEYTIL
jgi:hypothetical protein